MPSCKEAIKKWEAASGGAEAPEDAVDVKLTCMGLEKLDDSLNVFANVVKLSLAVNSIERIQCLKMRNLRILSLGRNQIKRIMGLDEIASTLEELWLSYNLIDKLDGLSNLRVLVTLYIGNNKIKQWEEVEKLAHLPELRNVMLYGNPVYGDKNKADYKESNAL